MADNLRRKSSLRFSLKDVKQRKKKKHRMVGKLRGRYLFRATVRLVLEYIDWLTEESPVKRIGDDVAINVKTARRKQAPEKKGLTIEDRSVLLIKPFERTKENKEFIYSLMRNLRAFKKYPDHLREALAAVCRYRYVKPNRIIVRQGHKAAALYFIVKGEVNLLKMVADEITGDTTESVVGTMGPGDMFGEIALLHGIPRTATVLSRTTVELLFISREDFDRILKKEILAEWDVLRDALVNFNYFKAWDDNTVRECCILSKLMDYQPNEVLLGDGKGMVNYVYFILSGKCRLIEHMLVREKVIGDDVKYQLYKPEDNSTATHERSRRLSKKLDISEGAFDISQISSTTQEEQMRSDETTDIDYAQLLLSMRPTVHVDTERMSVITLTLQDVVNQWHEITDVAAMLMREPSTISQQIYPKNVRTIFMQVCEFCRGACFGLDESLSVLALCVSTLCQFYKIMTYTEGKDLVECESDRKIYQR